MHDFPISIPILKGASFFLSLVQDKLDMPSGHLLYIGIVPEVDFKTVEFKNTITVCAVTD